MWNFQAKNSLDQCLVKYRIMWSRHRTRELIAMARTYLTGASSQFAYTFREIIPGADSLIAVVVDSALSCLSALDNVCHGRSQIARVSRRTHLVENDIDPILGGEQPQHRLHEVLAPLGIQPRCSEYQVIASGVNDCLLPFQLGFAIDAYRTGGVSFTVRNASIAVENIVSRYSVDIWTNVPPRSFITLAIPPTAT